MAAALLLSVTGCGQAPPPMPDNLPPQVEVSLPVYKDIRDFEDFTGQTEAVTSIDVRARVTGYLAAVHFEHGAEVAAGDVLFDIDPPYYKAEASRAEGLVAQAEARLARLRLDFERSKENLSRGVITQSAHDLMVSDLAEGEGALQTAQATLTIANVNLGYTKVRSPIAGRVSRPFIDQGNLVMADDTILTRVVSQDPMWVYFDLDERTLLKLRRASTEDTVASMTNEDAEVMMGLADEQGYPHQGVLNFEDNRVDPSTGTLRVRAVFDNKDRLLSPGLFVRVRLPIGETYRALLVPESALGTDQGQRFLYVVDEQGEVAYRRVEVGSLQAGLRVVTDGLAPNEKVVVVGLQRVMPGIKVDAKLLQPPAVQAAAPEATDLQR